MPQADANNPTTMVYDKLKIDMTMNAALNADSAKYMGGNFLLAWAWVLSCIL